MVFQIPLLEIGEMEACSLSAITRLTMHYAFQYRSGSKWQEAGKFNA